MCFFLFILRLYEIFDFVEIGQKLNIFFWNNIFSIGPKTIDYKRFMILLQSEWYELWRLFLIYLENLINIKRLCACTKTNCQQQLDVYILLFHFPFSGMICKTASNNSKSIWYYYNLARLFTYIRMYEYSVQEPGKNNA